MGVPPSAHNICYAIHSVCIIHTHMYIYIYIYIYTQYYTYIMLAVGQVTSDDFLKGLVSLGYQDGEDPVNKIQ